MADSLAIPDRAPIPAAQYLRVSTGHQTEHLEVQRATIQQYAEQHGFRIVRTYVDKAKSGLKLTGRTGLATLLHDVINGATYQAILVSDISRWGRFQNSDEAAHYEFLCFRAGVPVHYCAEGFVNDSSSDASIHKALKRVRAAEYSLRLSAYSFRGQKRLAEQGFRMGAWPGYGMRRLLITSDGTPQRILADGEYKSLQTDRVILIPGPEKEVAVVREIYDMVIRQKKTPTEIAKFLNARGTPWLHGRRWSRGLVKNILSNPKYSGLSVWNRTSFKLHAHCVWNPPDQWVVRRQVCDPIVEPRRFANVQRILKQLGPRWTRDELIGEARSLLRKKGHLTQELLENRTGVSHKTIRSHFGNLKSLYEAVGYSPPGRFRSSDGLRRGQLFRQEFSRALVRCLGPRALVHQTVGTSHMTLTLPTGVVIRIHICPAVGTSTGRLWRILFGTYRRKCDLHLLCILNRENTELYRLYLVPPIERNVSKLSFMIDDGLLRRGTRIYRLSQIPDAANILAAQ